jgi:hypothetical protein
MEMYNSPYCVLDTTTGVGIYRVSFPEPILSILSSVCPSLSFAIISLADLLPTSKLFSALLLLFRSITVKRIFFTSCPLYVFSISLISLSGRNCKTALFPIPILTYWLPYLVVVRFHLCYLSLPDYIFRLSIYRFHLLFCFLWQISLLSSEEK